MGYNKKWVVFLIDVVNLQRKMNQNRDANRLSVRVVRFVMMRAWFVTKYGVLCVVFCKRRRRRKRNEGGGEGVVCQVIT
jgi:hypothetical protein